MDPGIDPGDNTYTAPHQVGKTYMWRIRHIAIRLDLVDEIDVLRIFQKAAKEKHDIADKKLEEGVEDPKPYDEVNQFWTKINKILEKSLEYIKVCSDADNTITEEKHRIHLASQIQPEDNDEGVVAGSAEMRLGLYRQWFDVSKQRFLDSLDPTKNPELEELLKEIQCSDTM